MAKKSSKKLKITQIKSRIKYEKSQKATLDALGLHKMNQSVVKEDSPQIRGMVFKIKHLLNVEEITE